ncbi:hypothetical protein LTR10_009608 [Elasticomyces elasticus]|nr:hypothetical protein LTR10_009608 [Elasticomyces elasticus]KAK4971297.1 hypothetical protein LTR42_007023 [Elasticomyces elasticus]
MAGETPAKRQKLDDFESILSKLCEGQAALAQNIADLTKAQQVTNDKLISFIDHFHAVHPLRVKSTNAGTRLTETFELLENILLATSRNTVAAAQDVNKYFRSIIKNSKALRKKLSVPSAGTRLTTTFRVLEGILMNAPMETVFFAQRVNRTFKETISCSASLQHKLFLTQITADGCDSAPTFNPLLEKLSVLHRLPLYLIKNYLTTSGGNGAERLRPAMPVIRKSMTGSGVLSHRIDWRLRRATVAGWPGEGNKLTLRPGSWEDMYLTDVQTRLPTFHVGYFDGPGPDDCTGLLEFGKSGSWR